MTPIVAVLLAAVAGLAASALHEVLHQRRERRLLLLAGAIAKFPVGAILPEIAMELSLSAFQCGAVYADLSLLEQRGHITRWWDSDRGRMAWTSTDYATTGSPEREDGR